MLGVLIGGGVGGGAVWAVMRDDTTSEMASAATTVPEDRDTDSAPDEFNEGDLEDVLVAASVPGTEAPEDGQNLRGSFTLTDFESVVGDWTSCFGDGGYNDFGAGMNVTVRNEANEIVAVGSTRNLNHGDLNASTTWLADVATVAEEADSLWCTVVFETVVPDESDFYSVEIGRRGDLSYSRDELEANGWTIELSLGG